MFAAVARLRTAGGQARAALVHDLRPADRRRRISADAAGCDAHAAYFTEMLPGVMVFGLGLAATVSPLTAAILGDIDQRHAGIGSAINNAIARVAGLLAVAAFGAILAARFATALNAAASSHARPARADVPRRRPATARWSPRSPKDVGGDRRVHGQNLLEDASVSALHAGLLCDGRRARRRGPDLGRRHPQPEASVTAEAVGRRTLRAAIGDRSDRGRREGRIGRDVQDRARAARGRLHQLPARGHIAAVGARGHSRVDDRAAPVPGSAP